MLQRNCLLLLRRRRAVGAAATVLHVAVGKSGVRPTCIDLHDLLLAATCC